MDLTQERLKELLRYDPETGHFTRLVRGGGTSKAGEVTGFVSPVAQGRSYIKVIIKNRKFYAHRLAWLYMTGKWPADQIDHIDNDGTNNRWTNLRQATRGQNQRNVGPKSHNSSGVKGVYLDKRRGKWVAEIRHDGKRIHLGMFDTIAEAGAAYASAASKYHGVFARVA